MIDSSAALSLRSRSPRAMASPGATTSLLSINLPIYKVPRPSEAKPTLTEAVGCHVASATEKRSDPVSTPEREITSLATERKVSDLTFFVVLFSFVCLVFSFLFLYFLYVAFSKLFPSVLYEEESDYIGYNDDPSAMHTESDYDGYDDQDRDLV
ncbi:hypothetical protein D9613_004059 [Agrocybe pediades]|uniref:Transmembrane protein n=1 Tax=Agrocybe pediades TaxID=84607 RepID=A0A8H4QK26_9AGAR|nr:hypothetical protein D9613_004059 [Agrocybe pediades]